MSAVQQPAAWVSRLDRLHALADTREVTKQPDLMNAMLGCLAGLVDDDTWDKALEHVEQVTT